MSTRLHRIAVLFTALASLLCHTSAAEDRATVAETRPGETAKSSVEDFDYFVNNWNVIGLKDYVHGTRITPDNQLLLADKMVVQMRLGSEHKPLSRENPKRALHGWMPIIMVSADDGPVHYEITYWATPLPSVADWGKAFDWPTEGENFLNWIVVKATNTGDAPAEAIVDVAPYVPAPTPGATETRDAQFNDKILSHKFNWSWQLAPRESAEGIARYTFFPVESPGVYDEENPSLWLQRTAEFWQRVIDGAAKIEVPCRKATDALLAAHVCQLIANDQGEVHGGEGFYDEFYIRDGAYQVMELEEAGFADAAAKAIERYLIRQRDDGRFESQAGQFDANGQAVWTLWQYYRITNDREFLARVYPAMRRAAEWTRQARRTTPAPFTGVLPAGSGRRRISVGG